MNDELYSLRSSSFIIHNSLIPSPAFAQKTPILGPGKRPGPKHLPVCGYESQSAIQLSGGGENGVDGRTTARQGSCFGPSPDEPAFQPRQLRPPRESDAFEVVFGWPPVLKGKLWPRTEVINPRCFGNPCQPQTRVSSWPLCCSGGLRHPRALMEWPLCCSGGRSRYSLVSFRGRNRKAGEDHQAVAARQVLQGIHLLAPPATQHSPPAQKERHV